MTTATYLEQNHVPGKASHRGYDVTHIPHTCPLHRNGWPTVLREIGQFKALPMCNALSNALCSAWFFPWTLAFLSWFHNLLMVYTLQSEDISSNPTPYSYTGMQNQADSGFLPTVLTRAGLSSPVLLEFCLLGSSMSSFPAFETSLATLDCSS